MSKIAAFSTLLRGAATAALVTAFGIICTGCGGGGGGSKTPVSQDPADYPLRTVAIYTNDSPILETEQQAQFTIMLDEKTPVPLEVKIQFGGSARLEEDFNADHITSVLIPANSDSVTVTITSIDDGLDELYYESATLAIVTDSDYIIAADYTAYIDILDYYPEISVTASQTSISEVDGSAEFTISLSEYALSDMEIDFTWGGTATLGEDFSADKATVTIPAGEDTAKITVTPNNDGVTEALEAITLELIIPRATVAGAATSATVEIADRPRISVRAAAPVLPEGDNTTQFIFELSEVAESDLDVTFTLSGSATNHVDYEIDTLTPVTIRAGESRVAVTLTVKPDTKNEGDEEVVLTLEVPDDYLPGQDLTATVEIEDLPQEFLIEGLGMSMKPIPSGTFLMGSADNDPKKLSSELPQHPVTISWNFWMCSTETTVGQFQSFLRDAAAANVSADEGASPAETGVIATAFTGDAEQGVNFGADYAPLNESYDLNGLFNLYAKANKPMVGITRRAAINFCLWLTDRETLNGTIPTGYEFRLPTEAEWEYCCRAGSTTVFYYDNDETSDNGQTYELLGEHAWYQTNAEATQKVGQEKTKNHWGLYDMSGNVLEFCYDGLDDYASDPQVDPVNTGLDWGYVARGGGFSTSGSLCRSAARVIVLNNEEEASYLGFRVALAPIIP